MAESASWTFYQDGGLTNLVRNYSQTVCVWCAGPLVEPPVAAARAWIVRALEAYEASCGNIDPFPVEDNVMASDFYKSQTLDELAHEQGVKPVTDLEKLGLLWPYDGNLDKFLEWLLAEREERRTVRRCQR